MLSATSRADLARALFPRRVFENFPKDPKLEKKLKLIRMTKTEHCTKDPNFENKLKLMIMTKTEHFFQEEIKEARSAFKKDSK